MSQKTLSYWLKAVIIVVALVGVWLYGLIVPMIAESVREVSDRLYQPVLIFLLGTGVPCFTSLGFAWKIASEIGRDNSFSRVNELTGEREMYEGDLVSRSRRRGLFCSRHDRDGAGAS